MIFYTADTHFGDERIMKLCRRPHGSVDEMDRDLILRWNIRVGEDDVVYHLGDLAVSDEVAYRILPLLNGRVFFVPGNHDTVLDKSLSLIEQLPQICTVQDAGRSVALCHYPLLSYHNSIYGGYHVFGHIHNNPADPATKIVRQLPRSFNVGVDVCCFGPLTLDELIRGKQ